MRFGPALSVLSLFKLEPRLGAASWQWQTGYDVCQYNCPVARSTCSDSVPVDHPHHSSVDHIYAHCVCRLDPSQHQLGAFIAFVGTRLSRTAWVQCMYRVGLLLLKCSKNTSVHVGKKKRCLCLLLPFCHWFRTRRAGSGLTAFHLMVLYSRPRGVSQTNIARNWHFTTALAVDWVHIWATEDPPTPYKPRNDILNCHTVVKIN